jgi:hypothetical protein
MSEISEPVDPDGSSRQHHLTSAPSGDGKSSLRAAISKLPHETTHAYELGMAKLAAQVRRLNLYTDLDELMSDSDEDVRYGAFYCRCTILRTNRDYTILEEFMSRQGEAFRARPSYRHLELLTRVGLLDKFTDRDTFVRSTYDHAQTNPGNAGYVHMFAAVVALVMEAEEGTSSDIGRKWLDSALDAAVRTVELDRSYAKFHSTLGRLHSLNGNFSAARRELDQAVDLEDSSRSDYGLRITNYETQRMRNSLRESGWAVMEEIRAHKAAAETRLDEFGKSIIVTIEENKASLNAATKRIDEASTKNLEFLGFFAAILSFTIGSIQIATSLAAQDAARLIFVLMGGLLGVFAGFGMLVAKPTRGGYIRVGVVFVVGGLIVLSSFMLPSWPKT